MNCLCGCGAQTGPEGFDRATDYQYQYASDNGNTDLNIQTVDQQGNLYFVCQSYLMKYDLKQKTCQPLCTKANCLHEKETDQNRKESCNAYIPWKYEDDDFKGYSNIFYYKKNIYLAYDLERGKKNWHLVRISKDGKSRDEITSWTSEYNEMFQHRGIFYFSKGYVDDEGKSCEEVDYLDLNHPGRIRTLLKPQKGTEIVSELKPITAYGKYVYISFIGETSGATKDNYLDHLQRAVYVYNIETKKRTRVQMDGMKRTDIIQGIVPFQGRLFFMPTDMTNLDDLESTGTLYSCKPDGSDLKKEKENVPAWRNLYSDGNYLYISDFCYQCSKEMDDSSDQDKPNEWTVTTEVFDKGLTQMDSFTEEPVEHLPSSDIRIGIGNYRYNLSLNDDGSAYELHQWKKKDLGNLKGRTWTSEIVATIPHEDSSDSIVTGEEE